MADAGFEPATGQPGRGMKTRPAILRNPSRAAVTDTKQQTGSTETNGVSKRPVAQLQPPALKRTTCGDITNVCVNQASMCLKEENQNTMKAPRKQPMRSKQEAGAAENANEDLLNWFVEDNSLSSVTEVVVEAQSPASSGLSRQQQSGPRAFHLLVVCSLEEPDLPAIYAEDIYNYMTQREVSAQCGDTGNSAQRPLTQAPSPHSVATGQPHEGSSYAARKDAQMAVNRVDYTRVMIRDLARSCDRTLEQP
ncbi:uncharacterized protein LOC116968021 [Amblyraja radiata]|uniref:uncharacterized protein LOC116968021 n=1 Tax=Amblyraja radiata TaxID=386614 RepID=UPI001403CDEE|nr:uncharacterized protein LOC116968021 [Amblyraja radiata]